jgi:hypothetical protein
MFSNNSSDLEIRFSFQILFRRIIVAFKLFVKENKRKPGKVPEWCSGFTGEIWYLIFQYKLY